MTVGGVAATGEIVDNDTVTVSAVTDASETEGTDLVHTVTMSGASATDETYTFTLTDVTTDSATDYSAPTFSDGVTYDAVTGLITVPAGVTSFTVTTPTTDDALDENAETYDLTVGGVAATGEIVDNDTAPTALDASITGTEDTDYVFILSDFGFSDADAGDTLQVVKIDSLPVDGTLYLNGTAVVSGTEVTNTQINNGELIFTPDSNESGIDAYGSAGTGDQHNDYATFDYSVSDGSNWSANSATMTVDITPVADTPNLNVTADVLNEVTIDVNNVTSTGDGYTVTAYKLDGSVGTISQKTGSGATGFGVANYDGASHDSNDGASQEIQSDDNTGRSEAIVIEFDNYVSSVDVGFAWLNKYETAKWEFYDNGIKVGEGTRVHGSDNNDPAITISPESGVKFDEIKFTGPADGDDFLINTISFNRDIGDSDNVSIDENRSINIHINPSLTDSDGSESLALLVRDIPDGAILTDGINSFIATSSVSSVDVSGWDLNSLEFIAPNVTSDETYTLHIDATATETSNNNNSTVTEDLVINVNHIADQTKNYSGDFKSVLVTDGGDDTINIGDDIQESGSKNTQIYTNDGDDTITVHDNIHNASKIYMGSGDDTLDVGGKIGGSSTVDMGSGDDTLIINEDTDTSGSIDMGRGYDTLELHSDFDLDFSNANIAKIENLEAIDLEDGVHNITISLDDVLDMTEADSNTLDVKALTNDGDSVAVVNSSGNWSAATVVDNSDGTHSFEYTNSSSGDSITLTVDDQIDTTGM